MIPDEDIDLFVGIEGKELVGNEMEKVSRSVDFYWSWVYLAKATNTVYAQET